jgi:Fic family protein
MYTPKYTITTKILKHIGIIEACREVIDHAPLLPYYEKAFQTDAMVRSVHHGTHIEGNELDMDQAEKVMMGQQVVARPRDIQEVINYRRVVEFIDGLGQRAPARNASASVAGGENLDEISEELIKKLHKMTVEKILTPERCGVYRTTQVVVKNSLTGEVTFTPPPAIAVPVQLQALIDFINKIKPDEIHPVLKSAAVHYELVRIHPFVDGNGRMARSLSTLILFREGYDIRKFFSLEEYFDHNAVAYYDSLQSVGRNNGDLTQWLAYFTEGLAIELTKIKEKIEKISVDSKLKERLGGTPVLLSNRQLKIIEYIQETGYLQNQVFKTLFPMVSEDTVLNELKGLLKSGIIRKSGSTKGAKYVMSK